MKIAVHAPPVDGRANEALTEYLAETLRVSKTSVELINGKSSRSKLFLLKGLPAIDAETALRKTRDYFPGTE